MISARSALSEMVAGLEESERRNVRVMAEQGREILRLRDENEQLRSELAQLRRDGCYPMPKMGSGSMIAPGDEEA